MIVGAETEAGTGTVCRLGPLFGLKPPGRDPPSLPTDSGICVILNDPTRMAQHRPASISADVGRAYSLSRSDVPGRSCWMFVPM